MSPRRSAFFAVAVLLGLCAGQPRTARAQGTYTFTPIAVTDGVFSRFNFPGPVLNNAGAVAFNATLSSGEDGVFRVSAGSLATIALEDGFRRFGNPSINASGQVGFEASFRAVTGEGIFRGESGPITTIVGTQDAGDFDFVNAGPSLNAAGRVAFIGERILGPNNFLAGVWVGDGGPVTAIYDENGPFDDFNGNPSLNDGGQAAFAATLDTGVSGLFLGSGGTAFTTVFDETGPFSSFAGFQGPSLNENGDVAFNASLDTSESGIFLYRGGSVLTVADTSGALAGLSFSDPALNNNGAVAFVATSSSFDQFLLTGPDLAGDHVIATGDLLFGRTITGLSFSREGLNDGGQIAFAATFDDGSAGIFLATPAAATIPEPGTVILFVAALAMPGAALLLRRGAPSLVAGEGAEPLLRR